LSDNESDAVSVALPLPPSPYIKEEPAAKPRSAADLIKTEWAIIDALLAMVGNAKEDNKKAFIYQTLQGHIRTLSMLLKAHGVADQSQDLARVLSEIRRDVRFRARRLRKR
jgi:hypothetical protein